MGWQEKGEVIKCGLEPTVFVDGLCIHHWSVGGYTQEINYLYAFFYSSQTIENSESQRVIGLNGWCAEKEKTISTECMGDWRTTHVAKTVS